MTTTTECRGANPDTWDALCKSIGAVGRRVLWPDEQAAERAGAKTIAEKMARRAGRMGIARPRCLIDRGQAHQPHQSANPVTADVHVLAPHVAGHLAGTVERILQKQRVDPTHQRQVFRALTLRRVIERGSADRKQAALTAQAQPGTVARDHCLALAPAHRLSPLATEQVSRTRFPWTQNWLNRSVQGGPEHDR